MQINLNYKWFWLNFGWYSGDPFKTFSFTIGEVSVDEDIVTFFDIQIFLFSFSFGWCAR